jgi:hypothetical protein
LRRTFKPFAVDEAKGEVAGERLEAETQLVRTVVEELDKCLALTPRPPKPSSSGRTPRSNSLTVHDLQGAAADPVAVVQQSDTGLRNR